MTIYSVNFEQNFNFYKLFNPEQIVEEFLNVVESNFSPRNHVEVQGSFSLINYQPPEPEFFVEIVEKKAWMTEVYCDIF